MAATHLTTLLHYRNCPNLVPSLVPAGMVSGMILVIIPNMVPDMVSSMVLARMFPRTPFLRLKLFIFVALLFFFKD